MVIFNGGNSNLYIQVNFILISILFLFIAKEKNYLAHIKKIFLANKLAIALYVLFIFFLIFQILPLPVEWISFFSPEKYNYLQNLEYDLNFTSISLSSFNSYFAILNYFSVFLFLIIFKSLFYKQRYIFHFYFFLAFLGALTASIAIYFYLIGNPDFFILKNSHLKSNATGFFKNRTVFSCFLLLCFLSGIEFLKSINHHKEHDRKDFFDKIYVRIFILLITIGIITSFSRLGNFLFISSIILYISREIYLNNKSNRLFLITLILILFLDIIALGFYFGSEKLIFRFAFLQDELVKYLPSSIDTNITRGGITKFALLEFKKFIFFGYGSGGFEYLFKINFENTSTMYAVHAHSDLIQFLGELGIIGFSLIALSSLFLCANKNFFSFKNFLLFYSLIFILIFDFSFHIPVIQILFILLISAKNNQIDNFYVNYDK
ncbi:O-antigen ligase family protein [Candidatus Pelagibacter sp.]|nr:O-antigen ligase family protein [Candidatus Pelagibacter sp.]